jgi:hypothetical protein
MKIKKIILEAEPGDEISKVCHGAVLFSETNNKCAVEFTFNGVLVSHDGRTVEDNLAEQYQEKLNAKPAPKKK